MGQDIGGVGACLAALLDQPRLFDPFQGEVEQQVRASLLQQPVAEVRQHTVMEAGIVQLQAERVCEVDAAGYGFGRRAVREAVQELQHAHGRQLRRGQAGPAIARVPGLEVFVAPHSVEPVAYPHRRGARRIRRPRDLRRELRNHANRTHTNRHRNHPTETSDHRNLR